jgi:hypothetical protein
MPMRCPLFVLTKTLCLLIITTNMSKPYTITFDAEVGPVASRKLVSLDREHKVTFITDQSKVLELGALDPQLMVRVTVEVVD